MCTRSKRPQSECLQHSTLFTHKRRTYRVCLNRDLTTCFETLDNMIAGWPSARRCRAALTALLDRLNQRHRRRASPPPQPPTLDSSPNKRQRTDGFNTLDNDPSAATGWWNTQSAQEQPPIWQPVIEYQGPDFGFDSMQLADSGVWSDLVDTAQPELFDVSGWEAYCQTLGERLNF